MTGKQRVNHIIAMLFATAFACFAILALCAIIMTAQAQCYQSVPRTLDMGTFSVDYDSALMIPVTARWVCSGEYLAKTRRDPSWRFVEDDRVGLPRARHDDYTHSGYDRGHLCPAGDRSATTQLMRSTFIMTNVCPQVPALNRGAWKRLEEACRAIARNGRDLSIQVDAVFWAADTERIGRNGVAVPHGFVKTIRDIPTDTICYSKYFQNW